MNGPVSGDQSNKRSDVRKEVSASFKSVSGLDVEKLPVPTDITKKLKKAVVTYVESILGNDELPECETLDAPTYPETVVTDSAEVGVAARKALEPEIRKVLKAYDKIYTDEIRNMSTP